MRVISNTNAPSISPLIPHHAIAPIAEKARESLRQARSEPNAAGLLAAYTAENFFGSLKMDKEAAQARSLRMEIRTALSLEQIFENLDPKIKKLARILDHHPDKEKIAVLRPKLAEVSARFLSIVLKDAQNVDGIFRSESVLTIQSFLVDMEKEHWDALDLSSLDALNLSPKAKAGLNLLQAWSHAEAGRIPEARQKIQDVIAFLETWQNTNEAAQKLKHITTSRCWTIRSFWFGR